MSDLISRQAAIDAVKDCYCGGEDSCGEPWIYEDHAIKAIKQLPPANCSVFPNNSDTISRQKAIDALANTKDLVDVTWTDENDNVIDSIEEKRNIIANWLEKVPSAQPEQHTCVNCGRTANNGGWYADGGTRCPIEEHYALPKDGYCHLWEKRNVTDDDYPERRTDE